MAEMEMTYLPGLMHYRLDCECGFWCVLGTREAAEDTARWHLGQRSHLGTVSGIQDPTHNDGTSE